MEEKPAAGHGDLYEFRLLYNSRDPGQVWKASVVHAFDVWSQVELVDRAAASPPAPDNVSPSTGVAPQPSPSGREKSLEEKPVGLRLETADGQALTGYLLFTRLVRSLRLLWPLAALTWIPGVAYVGQALWPGRVARAES
jgi:hypothetical protein